MEVIINLWTEVKALNKSTAEVKSQPLDNSIEIGN